MLEQLLVEDPSRRHLPVEELKRLVRKEKNKVAAAASRHRVQHYTSALESQVRQLQEEHSHLATLVAPPEAGQGRVVLGSGVEQLAPVNPPVRHLSV